MKKASRFRCFSAVAVHINEVRRNHVNGEGLLEESELMPLSEEQLGLLDDVLVRVLVFMFS